MNVTIAKKEQVRSMFNSIAGKYDFLNHFLSVGIDKSWRKKLVKLVVDTQPRKVLDVATGTADLAITLASKSDAVITGVDISQGMLDVGVKKLKRKGLEKQITLALGDSEQLPFQTASFDASMVAFGVRNFEDLDKGLSEMYRTLKPGGMIAILEFSRPKAFPIKQLYNFYFLNILPLMGRLVSKDKGAYTYLPESVNVFPEGKDFLNHLQKCGFTKLTERRLTFGIASIYTGKKN